MNKPGKTLDRQKSGAVSPFPTLFSHFRLGPYQLKNRLVALPVYTGYAHPDGRVSALLIEHYSRLAASGVALVNGESAEISSCISSNSIASTLGNLGSVVAAAASAGISAAVVAVEPICGDAAAFSASAREAGDGSQATSRSDIAAASSAYRPVCVPFSCAECLFWIEST